MILKFFVPDMTPEPKGYLISLNSVVTKSDTKIGDIKRTHMLFIGAIEPETSWSRVDCSYLFGGTCRVYGGSAQTYQGRV